MEPWRDWSGLLPELLAEISIRIPSTEDFMAFRGVCSPWRAAASKDKFVNSCHAIPLLMLPEKRHGRSDEREFYSLSRRKIAMRLPLPEAKGEVNLLNPFSRSLIHLPNLTKFPVPECYRCTSVQKAVFSANPCHTPDFVLMVIHSLSLRLGFWRPGNSSWTAIALHTNDGFMDVNYCNGKFYAIDSEGKVCVWDESAPDLEVVHLLFRIDDAQLFVPFRYTYLVQSSEGELLLVSCWVADPYPNGIQEIANVKVIQLDVARHKWKRITSLGEDAVFFRNGAAFCIQGSTFPDLIKAQLRLSGIGEV
ncbi:OLC1v1030209C1 [Oldenlandia corymbosa var. corymbosa]|uniref:OLC1v1030209C1 n=1 Tax=Oldenlandia corymbosa var. corymbosa TaxID=529605 RepID=A0AAV1CIL6_OLDCO|nr:OLC1v1030209C1 [Oldenlandia corymbosa var. corymbosa]